MLMVFNNIPIISDYLSRHQEFHTHSVEEQIVACEPVLVS